MKMCVTVMGKDPLLIKFNANGDGSFQGEDLPSHKSNSVYGWHTYHIT